MQQLKYITVLLLVFAISVSVGALYSQKKPIEFNRAIFYKLLSEGTVADLDQQLDVLKLSSFDGKEAFEGSLMMKKAGLVKGAKKKLNLFKEGQHKLEGALRKDSLNIEYRFLRLIIQEHSPGILGYKGDLTKDKNYVRENFRKLAPVVQQAVVDYSKTSGVLHLENY